MAIGSSDERGTEETTTTDAVVATDHMPRAHWISRWHAAVAFGVYTVLTCAFTFPLVVHLGDSVGGKSAESDNTYFAWSLWIFRHSIEGGRDPGHTHNIFALLPSVQIFVDAHFDEVVGWFLQYFMSPLAAYNLLIWLGFALSGLTMYLLVQEFVSDRFACFAAGFLYTFSAFHFGRYAGHLGLATLQWLPFCAWRLFVLIRRPTWLNAILAGVGIALVAFSDIYYIGYFLVPFGLLFALGMLVMRRDWLWERRNLARCGVALIVALVLITPILPNYFNIDPDVRESVQREAQLGTELLSANLLAFILPHPDNPWLGSATLPVYSGMPNYFGIESAVFLGYPALLLGLTAFLFRRNRTRIAFFWLILGIGGLVLSLGPRLHIGSHLYWRLPSYTLLFGLPFLSNYRAPNRLVVLPLFALAVLSAYGIAAWVTAAGRQRAMRLAVRAVVVLLLGTAVAQQVLWDFPAPSSPVRVSALYQEIGADPGDGLLLDVPIQLSAKDEYLQTIHHKRLVFGYAPRTTFHMLGSVYLAPYLAAFDATYTAETSNLIATQGDILPVETFRQSLQDRNITYIVLHEKRFTDPARLVQAREYLTRGLGAPFSEDTVEGLAVWRIAPAAHDPGAPNFTFGSGWLPEIHAREGRLERIVTQDGQVIITAPRAEMISMDFLATPYFRARTLEVRLNDAVVNTTPLSNTTPLTSVTLRQLPLRAGVNVLDLHLVEGCSLPREYDPSNLDTRCFGFGVQQIEITTPEGLLASGAPQEPNRSSVTFGSGWLAETAEQDGQTIRVIQQDAKVLLATGSATETTISFAAQSVLKPATLEVRLNTILVQTVPLAQPGVSVPVAIDRAMLRTGTNVLEFHVVEGCVRPTEIDPHNGDTRCFGVIIVGLHIQGLL